MRKKRQYESTKLMPLPVPAEIQAILDASEANPHRVDRTIELRKIETPSKLDKAPKPPKEPRVRVMGRKGSPYSPEERAERIKQAHAAFRERRRQQR